MIASSGPKVERLRLIVVGAGGHASVVIDAARKAGHVVEGVVADPPGTSVLGVPVRGTVSAIPGLFKDGLMDAVTIAIGDNAIRRRLAEAIPQHSFCNSSASISDTGGRLHNRQRHFRCCRSDRRASGACWRPLLNQHGGQRRSRHGSASLLKLGPASDARRLVFNWRELRGRDRSGHLSSHSSRERLSSRSRSRSAEGHWGQSCVVRNTFPRNSKATVWRHLSIAPEDTISYV